LKIFGVTIVLSIALLCGCASVYSVVPVGEREKEVSQNDWEGLWINREQVINIKVLDKAKGLLLVAWLEDKEGDFKLESYQVEIRGTGEWTFGNMKEKEGDTRYYWGLIEKEKNQIIIWTPEPSQFKKLVRAELLTGNIEKGGDVVLEKLTVEHLKLIMSEDKGVCFDWKKPIVFFRLWK